MAIIRFFLPVFLAIASLAHAGVVVTMVPTPAWDAYEPGQMIRVEVFAQLDGNSPSSVLVRGMQFNLSDSDPSLHVAPVATHPPSISGDGLFWDFSTSSACNLDPYDCGAAYFTNSSLVNHNLSAVYWSPAPSSNLMFHLSQSAPTRVGVLDVVLPYELGAFVLDLLNADEPDDLNYGSWLIFGFGDSDSDDPRTEWAAYNGSIVGGTHVFYIIPEPATLSLLLLGTAFFTTKTRRKNGGVQ